MSRVGREDAARHAMALDPHFFDILHMRRTGSDRRAAVGSRRGASPR